MMVDEPVASALFCRDSGAHTATREGGQASSSTSVVGSPPTSSVLRHHPVSNGGTAVSASAQGSARRHEARREAHVVQPRIMIWHLGRGLFVEDQENAS